MATITLNATAYNDAMKYAKTQNISVDEFVVSLITNYVQSKKKKFSLQPIEELAPELQEILNMPINGQIDADDINGEKARMEYYKEKYELWKSSFEDMLQFESAYATGCELIITRNKKHFPQDAIQLLEPSEFFDCYWSVD